MNAKRRKTIISAIHGLTQMDPDLTAILDDLEDVLFDEEEARDATPEPLQNTERWEICCESCNCLEEAIDMLRQDEASGAGDAIPVLLQIDGIHL